MSLFAVAVLVNLTLSVREDVALSGLFLVQFALAALVPGAAELLTLSVVYLVLAAVLLVRARHRLGRLVGDGPAHPPPAAHRPARPGPAAARTSMTCSASP